MKELSAIQVKALDVGSDWLGAGANHEPVVRNVDVRRVRTQHPDSLRRGIDGQGAMVQQEFQSGVGEIVVLAVGEVVPVRGLAADVEGQPADAVVGEAVGRDQLYLN